MSELVKIVVGVILLVGLVCGFFIFWLLPIGVNP